MYVNIGFMILSAITNNQLKILYINLQDSQIRAGVETYSAISLFGNGRFSLNRVNKTIIRKSETAL